VVATLFRLIVLILGAILIIAIGSIFHLLGMDNAFDIASKAVTHIIVVVIFVPLTCIFGFCAFAVIRNLITEKPREWVKLLWFIGLGFMAFISGAGVVYYFIDALSRK